MCLCPRLAGLKSGVIRVFVSLKYVYSARYGHGSNAVYGLPRPAARRPQQQPLAVACFSVCYANQLFATVAIAVLFVFAWVAAGRIFVEMDSFKFSPKVPKNR